MFNPNSLPFNVPRLRMKRGWVFGALIMVALLAFEMFNYSTTDFALGDLLGDLNFMGIRWATILAVAFCGIDFAGVARLFTPEQGADEPAEVWYLFGAWVLAAAMNAILTWWGVSVAIMTHVPAGNEILSREVLIKVVPIFVAAMVWLIRILIIGTFSVAGERIFTQADRRQPRTQTRMPAVAPRATAPASPVRQLAQPAGGAAQPVFRPAAKPVAQPPSYNQSQQAYSRQEPTYHPLSMSGQAPVNPQDRLRR